LQVPEFSPTGRRQRLAAELRRLREQSGHTSNQIARDIGWSASKISRYELARTGLKPDDVARLLDYYGVETVRRSELLALASEATRKGWWEAYSDVLPDEYAGLIGMEEEARSCLIWQVECVPGLLQTEAYARQINSGYQPVSGDPPGSMERRVEVRMRRQRVLTQDPPLELSVVLDESALLRQVADESVMGAQMDRLVETSDLPHVRIRIVPLHGRRPIMIPSFVVLAFGEAHDAGLDDVVSTENVTNTFNIQSERQTYPYRRAFKSLVDAALPEPESRTLIADTAKRVWR
jgi:transcriptional regulator with XRE-family HTH domain